MRIQREQAARRARLAADYDLEPPQGGSITGSALDAKLSAVERAGGFKDLSGAGKPLPERVRTHFGDEDAADRMMQRIMAENNVKPESLEIRSEYLPKLRAFRARLAQLTGPAANPIGPSTRKSLEHQMGELRQLHASYHSASVKDTFTFNLQIGVLPKVAETLEQELARARVKDDS